MPSSRTNVSMMTVSTSSGRGQRMRWEKRLAASAQARATLRSAGASSLKRDSSTHTFTVNSVADALGRFDTSLTGYSVLVSPGIVGIQMKNLNGWQSGGTVTLACNSALLKYAVLRTN